MSLPSSVNYREPIPSLPENSVKYSVALAPVNGSSFNAGGQQIIFQLPNRGYLIPDSVYLRYKIVVANATTAANMLATPFYTPFSRLETQFGSVTVDSINQYNQVANLMTNLSMDVAQKYGMQSALGYTVSGTPTIEELDSAVVPSTGLTAYFAGPLPCLLTNVNKLLPLWAMPTVQMVLTTDALSNMFDSVATITGITLSNVELCFDFVDFGSEVDNEVRQMGDKVYVKSQSYSNASVSIPASSNGSQNIIFNQRYASVKAGLVTFSGAVNNKIFDAVDITNGTGDYSISISGIQYPQKPLSALNNKGGILQELRKTVGSIYDNANSMSINSLEFGRLDSAANSSTTAPGKFVVPFALQKLHSNALLTGISTNNSNISVNINQTTSTSVIRTCNLTLVYDALVEIDLINKQASVKV